MENARKALEKALQTVKAQAAQIEELSKQVRFQQSFTRQFIEWQIMRGVELQSGQKFWLLV